MAGAFQSSAFQNSAFQTDGVVPDAVVVAGFVPSMTREQAEAEWDARQAGKKWQWDDEPQAQAAPEPAPEPVQAVYGPTLADLAPWQEIASSAPVALLPGRSEQVAAFLAERERLMREEEEFVVRLMMQLH